jgi:hypothetical protein
MAKTHDDKLRLLNAATQRIRDDETLTFDEVMQLCVHQLKEWSPGGTDGAKTEIAKFIEAAARRAEKLTAT